MSYRVFVVAGDNEMMQALSSELGDTFEVTNVASSNEALWELQRGAPDVLIADLDLSGFSGLDLADLVPDFAPTTRVVLHARNPAPDLDEQAEQRSLFRLLKGAASTSQLRQAVADAIAAGPAPVPEPVQLPEPPAPPPVAPPKPAPPRRTSPSVSAAIPPTPSDRSSTPFAVSKAPPLAPMRKGPPQVSARPDSPGRSTLASRMTTPPRAALSARPPAVSSAVPAAAPAPPPPTPPPADEPRKRRQPQGPLVLTAEKLAPIRARLKDLGLQLGAQATVLTDRWGVPLVEEGRTSLPLPPYLPLLATSFSTMIDYTSQLHTAEGAGLYMHEGARYDLYIFDVGSQFLLVMVFDKEIASSKLGSVWLYAKRAVRELAEELEGA